MFNRHTSGLGGRVVRRFAPLAATVAVLAGVAGTAAGPAQAGSFTDGHWASMSVSCHTGLSGYRSMMYWTQVSGPGIQMQTRMFVNGVYAGVTSWTTVTNADAPLVSVSVSRGTRVQLQAQFRKVVNGRWQYSPNGAFENLWHYSYLYASEQQRGASCLFF